MTAETVRHTPGPWFASSSDDGKTWSVISASMTTKSTICYIYGNRSAAAKPIDAHLIAAAPDMLAALKECQSALAMMIEPNSITKTTLAHAFAQATKARAKARAAITKAEGRQP